MPDLTILGKIVGGGLPAAAFGGRGELMERLAPVGDVYQAGTLSGNPLATAAGTSVLRRLRDPEVYEGLERRGARLEAGLAPFGTVQRVGAMLTLFCQDDPVRDYDEAARSDTERYAALFRHRSSAASTWRRPSSSARSSRSRTGTRRSTGRSRPLAILRQLSPSGKPSRPRPRRRARSGPVAAAAGERETVPVFSRSASGLRPRGGDDLRGLPPPLRRAAAVRSARRRYGAAPRRLPLRARTRPDRGDRQRRGGARSRGADLALRPGARRGPPGRGGGMGRDGGAARAERAHRGRRELSDRATRRRCASSRARPRERAVERACGAHDLRVR